VRDWIPDGVEHFEAVGCAECNETGYRGRVPVLEILVVDGEVERCISAGEPADRVVEAARTGGMRSLWDSGVQHVLNGVTSVDELLRVLDVPDGGPARATPPRGRAGMATPFATTPVAESAVPAPPAPVLTASLFELVDEVRPPLASHGDHARVLLVEDEAPLRGVLRDLLAREGFEVLEAADGVEALVAVDREGPDVVVLDLTLPRLDGYGVLGRLRTRRDTQDLPVLVLTAREDEEAEVRVFELGADDFLSKPFRARALIARLRALLRRAAPAAPAPRDVPLRQVG
jgi:CheY-like chemotaxis protein